MAIEFDRIWRTFRTRGPKIALIGLGSALGFLILNKLAENAVTGLADKVFGYFHPPTFLVVYTKKAPVTDWTLLRYDSSAKMDAKFKQPGENSARDYSVEVTTVPGIYTLQLLKKEADGARVLTIPVPLLSPSVPVYVDTSEDKWGDPSKTTHYEDAEPGAPVYLIGTRWTVTPLDWELEKSASDQRLQHVLTIALGQVGVSTSGTDWRPIEKYWSATGYNERPHRIEWWGGAFLGWVLLQSGINPPSEAADFRSWTGWGETVSVDQAEPGMIAIFDYPETPSKLLVGVLLRKGATCTEAIVGKIADRVVITCVATPLHSIRKPPKRMII